MWPDAPALRAYLDRTSRRLAVLAVLEGAAVGLAIALDVALLIALLRWSHASSRGTIEVGRWLAAAGLTAGIAIAVTRRRRSMSVASEVERRVPACRNVIVTAAEVIDDPTRVEPYVGEMVCREAVRQVSTLDPATLFPARRAVAALGGISVAWVIALVVVAAQPPPAAMGASAPPPGFAGAVVNSVDVIVTQPAYSGRPAQTLHNPARVEALAGSRLHLTVRADADSVVMETLTGRAPLAITDQHIFTGDIIADADGFLAIEPSRATRGPGGRRLIGLSVTPDHSPRVTITAPGKDLFLTDTKRAIDVAIDADDDLGLASLTLRYTKVSGSGEKFTFVDGEVPIAIARGDDRTWKARGTLRLDALKLEHGDMVVYRGIATDRRPGAIPTESDAFIVEITSPGLIAADGFAMDDRQDKYALSQQMVILKTERLMAKAPTIAAESLRYQSQTIAAEQRAVRAEFVFMMGGELAEEVIAAAGLTDLNEEAEAAGEADLAAGRMLNRGRVALVQAIRFMSRASASLNNADLTKALAEEKAALKYLQQAFSRTRYLLRALTQRERLDLSRRLTGVLATAARDVKPAVEPTADARLMALRRTLAGIATLAADSALERGSAAAASLLAQRVLEVDPSSDALQKVSGDLTSAAAASGLDRNREARRLLDDAATRLASVIRAGLVNGTGPSRSADVARLQGGLSDELRRLRGGR